MLKFIPITAQAGIVGFESPAAEYTELGLSLDSLLIDKPAATFIGYAQGKSMMDDGIHDGDLLIVCLMDYWNYFDAMEPNFVRDFMVAIGVDPDYAAWYTTFIQIPESATRQHQTNVECATISTR